MGGCGWPHGQWGQVPGALSELIWSGKQTGSTGQDPSLPPLSSSDCPHVDSIRQPHQEACEVWQLPSSPSSSHFPLLPPYTSLETGCFAQVEPNPRPVRYTGRWKPAIRPPLNSGEQEASQPRLDRALSPQGHRPTLTEHPRDPQQVRYVQS